MAPGWTPARRGPEAAAPRGPPARGAPAEMDSGPPPTPAASLLLAAGRERVTEPKPRPGQPGARIRSAVPDPASVAEDSARAEEVRDRLQVLGEARRLLDSQAAGAREVDLEDA